MQCKVLALRNLYDKHLSKRNGKGDSHPQQIVQVSEAMWGRGHALVVLLLATANSAVSQNHSQNYCVDESSLVYTYENEPSIVGTFVECLKTVQDAMIAPYYDTGVRINVSTEVFLNNLIDVDEVSSTVTLDFFFNTIWVSEAHHFKICQHHQLLRCDSFSPSLTQL